MAVPTKLTIDESLAICKAIKDRIMKEDRSLEDRLREGNAISYLMNLAQSTIYNSQVIERKSSLEIFAEVLAERENKA